MEIPPVLHDVDKADPAAFGGTNIEMYPSFTACAGRVMSDAAAVRKQCLCVGSDSFHRNIVDPDIGGSAVEMLTIPGGIFEGAVVGCGAVSASETHRLTEVVPDRLE